MPFNVPWTQPYPGLSKTPVRRITVEVPVTDANSILSVTLNSAILATICQYAIKHTAADIRARELTYADATEFLDHVCKRTYSQPSQEAVESDDRGGVAGVLKGDAAVGDESAGVGKETTTGREGEGGQTRKKKSKYSKQ